MASIRVPLFLYYHTALISSTEYPINKRFQTHFAIVLGVVPYKDYVSASDTTSVDAIRSAKIYTAHVNTDNEAPANGILLSFGYGCQFLIGFGDKPTVYVRNHNGQRWVSWGKIVPVDV